MSSLPPPVAPSKLVATALYLLAFPGITQLLAGDWGWTEGWLWGGWFVAMSASVVVYLYRKDPALLAERYRKPGSGGQSLRDRATVYLVGLSFLSWLVLMPLDARRFGWTPRLPLAVEAVGGVLLALSWLLLYRSFADNTFASPLVRIQRERAHRVVSTGVYGFVRHPMYLGASLMLLGAPLLTGALVALAAGALVVLQLAVRIGDEERLLARELAGYEDYRRRVRYRLLPRVW
jgi:protein-S-isoprenylcysteine O-methyltransferase Ste14